jgi:hypothetical protein
VTLIRESVEVTSRPKRDWLKVLALALVAAIVVSAFSAFAISGLIDHVTASASIWPVVAPSVGAGVIVAGIIIRRFTSGESPAVLKSVVSRIFRDPPDDPM